ncbi:MAG: hypothetical protein ACFB0G_11265 [Leptolyngbyaceae cyanobacterium]
MPHTAPTPRPVTLSPDMPAYVVRERLQQLYGDGAEAIAYSILGWRLPSTDRSSGR